MLLTLHMTAIRTRLSRLALTLTTVAILGCVGVASSPARGASRASKAGHAQASKQQKCAAQSHAKKRRNTTAWCSARVLKSVRRLPAGKHTPTGGGLPPVVPSLPPVFGPLKPVLGGNPPVHAPEKHPVTTPVPTPEPPPVTTPVPTPEPPPVPTEEPAPAASPFRFFSPTSIWNASLPAGAELDPNSAADMAALNLEVTNAISKHTLNINTAAWSIPIYTVPANQPMVKVKLNKPGGERNPLQYAWEAVPVPPNAQPAKGTDKSLLVYQPSTDRLWEFWTFEWTSTGPVAGWGGAMQNVSTNPGAYNTLAWPRSILNKAIWEIDVDNWGGSASSLSIAGGLMTLEDLERGKINHALSIALPNVKAGVWAVPAQRTDGKSLSPQALPEGAHLRLDPNLDLSTLHLPPFTLMMAEAAQRYGIVVRDAAANITFYGQDPTPTGTNPYLGTKGYFENKAPYNLLASFPWSHLQLLKMELK
jgi:hypothetical protein